MRVRLPRGVVLLCALAAAGQSQAQVVISQVYGGGGNSGATYKSDFIELHNNGTSAINLAGWSVQYASAAGSSWQVTPLSGSIGPGAYYLIKQADGTGGTADLPTPDATGTLAMSGTAGKVLLSNSGGALSGTCPSGYVDLVGFGATASCAEGNAPTAAPSNTLAVLRNQGGCSDSDNNAADFSTGAPTPRNTSATVKVCAGGNQPVASMADVRLAEGHSGQTPFVFTVALSQPAGSGGVSFNVATRNGTATAGSDYTALSQSTVTIAEGGSTAQITVQVLGDTANEPDETFFVDISAIQGALPATLTATGTILNDDFNLLPIHAIQGSGDTSPYAGQVVAFSGIVTARRSAGFFVQMPDAEADSDPRTSEGIYVYTGSAPNDAASVGNRVSVQGTVVEYVPTADPSQPPLTEITAPTVLLQATGQPLPTPIALTVDFPDPKGAFDQLEALEGMRVTAASLTVNAPTLGTVNETSATATSNGVFHAVVTGLPRAYRTAGVQEPDPLPAGSPAEVPRWNTNPQVIAVGSAGLGGERLNLASGCVVSSVTGPLDYSFRRYTIYPETTPSVECAGNDQPRPAPAALADDVSVATYNMERFFDDQNDPAIGEPVLTPVAYQNRLNKASLAVRNFLNMPDILGTVEVENLQVLQTLAKRINDDAVAAGQTNPQYVAYLQEGNDVGGIDVGFLVKTAEVSAGLPRVAVAAVTQFGKDTVWAAPGGATSLLNDRPPLLLQAQVNFADGRQQPISALVVHQRSLNGAEEDTPNGERVRAKRQAQADFVADLLQARQQANPSEQMLVMGDFNAFEFNDGYVDAMGTITGYPAPDQQTVVSGDGVDRVTPGYDNLTLSLPPDQSYSYVYDGNAQSLDHIIANQALMQSTALETLVIGHARLNADFPATARNDPNTPTRLSDHDPTVVLLRLKARRFADLGVAANASPSPVMAGSTINYTVKLDNHGPDAAEFAAVAFVFDAVVTPVVAAPAGWSCQAPQITTTTTITCTTPLLASGTSPTFTLTVATSNAMAGMKLMLAASAQSQTPDPQTGNDNAAVTVAIQAPAQANLAVSIAGPSSVPVNQLTAVYTVTVRNHGTAPATAPTLQLQGNTLAATANVTAMAGWQCSKTALSGARREVQFACTGNTPLAAGAQATFSLKTNVRPAPADGLIQVQAEVSASSADADPSDNSASFTTQAGCTGRGC